MKNFLLKCLVATLLTVTISSTNAQVRVQSRADVLEKATTMFWKAVPENAEGGDLWEMIPNMAFTVIYRIGNRFYMKDIYAGRWTYGDTEELCIVNVSSLATQIRYVEDTGEIFAVGKDYVLGYMNGDLSCTWAKVPTH